MWDTQKHASKVCEVLLPTGVEQQSSIEIYSSSASFMSKVKYEVSKKLINKQKVDNSISSNANLLYMWGAFPKNTDKPFILELDNPYTPAYYHLENFKKNKEKISAHLNKAYKITYLSETCKNHAIELYGKDLEKKSFVNYPYMSDNYKKNNRSDDGIINFIFVGLNSRGKGGDELLEAFTHTKKENIRLTFISNLSNEGKSKYQKDNRITILPPQPREKLLNEIYPKMDVMIFPSFYESFGVVLLEALSFGMGIITLNTYATPEIVQNDYNGKLLHHPILKPTILNGKEIVNCVDLRIQDFHDRYLKHDEFYYGMYEELKSAIFQASNQYRKWQENSLALFENKFSPTVWLENVNRIVNQ
jgi:glycosyltransferase involved in cell wall biosynthesis